MRKISPRAISQAFILTAVTVMMVAGFVVMGGFGSQDDAEAFFPCIRTCNESTQSESTKTSSSYSTSYSTTYTDDDTTTETTSSYTTSTYYSTDTTFDGTIGDPPDCRRRWFCRDNWF